MQTGAVAILLAILLAVSTGKAETIVAKFNHQKDVFNDLMDARYRASSPVVSQDIVMMGDTITIDKPIRTNGGDIIIVADKLHVAAPLDTRVYIRHPRDTFHDWILENAPDVNSVFDKYYGTEMVWQDDKKVFAPVHVPLEKDGKRPLPRLPSGTTGLRLTSDIYNGTDAPHAGINWDNVQSGNILIIAAKVEFCESCHSTRSDVFKKIPVPDAERSHTFSSAFPECRPDPQTLLTSPYETGLFIIKGINGGLGGIGSINQNCKFDTVATANRHRFYCLPRVYDFRGGESGSAGYGGRGGRLEFFGMHPSAVSEDGNVVRDFVDSAHGFKSYRRLGTPSFNQLRQYPSRCGFSNLVKDAFDHKHPFYEDKFGFSGITFIPGYESQFIFPQTAFPYLWKRLKLIEARVDSKVGESIADSQQPLEERGLKPSELLNLYLHRKVNQSRGRIISALTEQKEFELKEGLLSPLFFWQMKEERLFSDTSLQSTFREILRLNVAYDNGRLENAYSLSRYFYNVGGVFNISGGSPQDRIDHVAARTELVKLNELLVNQLHEIRLLRADVLDILTLDTRSYYETKLANINQAIEGLRKAIPSDRNGIEVLGEVARAATSAYQAFNSAQYVAALEHAHRAFQLTGQMTYVARPSEGGAALRAQYEAYETHFLSLLEGISSDKERLLARTSQTYVRLRDANVRYFTLMVAASDQFQPLLQRALLTYLGDNDDRRLSDNLANLSSLIDRFPLSSSTFQVLDFDPSCAGKPSPNLDEIIGKDVRLDCVALPIDQDGYTLSFDLETKRLSGQLPAIVVQGGQARAPINFFGLLSGRQLKKLGRSSSIR